MYPVLQQDVQWNGELYETAGSIYYEAGILVKVAERNWSGLCVKKAGEGGIKEKENNDSGLQCWKYVTCHRTQATVKWEKLMRNSLRVLNYYFKDRRSPFHRTMVFKFFYLWASGFLADWLNLRGKWDSEFSLRSVLLTLVMSGTSVM